MWNNSTACRFMVPIKILNLVLFVHCSIVTCHSKLWNITHAVQAGKIKDLIDAECDKLWELQWPLVTVADFVQCPELVFKAFCWQ